MSFVRAHTRARNSIAHGRICYAKSAESTANSAKTDDRSTFKGRCRNIKVLYLAPRTIPCSDWLASHLETDITRNLSKVITGVEMQQDEI